MFDNIVYNPRQNRAYHLANGVHTVVSWHFANEGLNVLQWDNFGSYIYTKRTTVEGRLIEEG